MKSLPPACASRVMRLPEAAENGDAEAWSFILGKGRRTRPATTTICQRRAAGQGGAAASA